MKDIIHYVIEAVLAIAVVILFVLSSGNKPVSKVVTGVSDTAVMCSKPLPFAYVDIDSLMQNYTLSIDLNEQLAKKIENAHVTLTEKKRKLQSEAADFDRKLETGSFLNRERAEAEQHRLQTKAIEIKELEEKMTLEIQEDQQRMNIDLSTTVISQVRNYNRDKGYQIIYGKSRDNILYADDVYNITAEVIDYLNSTHQTTPLKPE
ncbi:MAG: OmpH family outer membrane protein [Tannerella sp.]|nr:OmpH family outer membrane protein [Tannerella sp.]